MFKKFLILKSGDYFNSNSHPLYLTHRKIEILQNSWKEFWCRYRMSRVVVAQISKILTKYLLLKLQSSTDLVLYHAEYTFLFFVSFYVVFRCLLHVVVLVTTRSIVIYLIIFITVTHVHVEMLQGAHRNHQLISRGPTEQV